MPTPFKFKSPDALQKKIDTYFARCEKTKEPLTLTGLCLAIGTNKMTLHNYEKKDAFAPVLETAKLKLENFVEKKLFTEKNVAGPIFWLKNFGWKDTQDVAVEGTIKVNIVKFSEADFVKPAK